MLEFVLSHLASKKAAVVSPSHMLLQAEDMTAAGSTEEFLKSKLVFEKDGHGQDICSVEAGGERVGVMMGWERGISESLSYTSRTPAYVEKCRRPWTGYAMA